MNRVELLIGDDVHSQIVAKTFAAAAAACQVAVGVWTVQRKSGVPSDPKIAKWRKLETSVLPNLLSASSHHLAGEEASTQLNQYFCAQGAAQAAHVADVNAPAFVDELVGRRPDLVVSVRCYQKFTQPTIDAFSFGDGATRLLNLHPGRLPAYRGVMTLLHQLVAHDLQGPATLHSVSPNWDDGAVLAISDASLSDERSLLSNYMSTGVSSGRFLLDQVAKARAVGLKRYLEAGQPQKSFQAGYFSIKDAAAMLEFELIPLSRVSDLQRDARVIFDCSTPQSLLEDPDFDCDASKRSGAWQSNRTQHNKLGPRK